MEDFKAFVEELRVALPHLHDPNYQARDVLYRGMGCDPVQGAGPVQAAIMVAIDELAPVQGLPADSRARRWHDALYMHRVLGLTQEETAERLCLSVRHLQRVQVEAIYALAQRLWSDGAGLGKGEAHVSGATGVPVPWATGVPVPWATGVPVPWATGVPVPWPNGSSDQSRTESLPGDWRALAGQELQYLTANAPDARARVGDTLEGILRLLDPVVKAKYGTSMRLAFVQPGLVTALHPTALRQTLITAILWLIQGAAAKELSIYALLEGGEVKVTLTVPIAPEAFQAAGAPEHDVFAPPGVAVELGHKGGQAFLWVRMPAVGTKTVLVVEDNPDMVRFYQRCAAGTRYRVVHLPPTEDVVARIQELAPDGVVLDVMLPDIDGWQILTHLHELPETRTIPVIVCSVVREEELALALGARLFLAKPIQPRRFVEALDQALDQGAASDAPAQANSSVAG